MEGKEIAHLRYEVECDLSWRTRRGFVSGSLGDRSVERVVTVSPEQRWQVNGSPVEETNTCIDLDLNFTPATNLIQFRRLELTVGESVEAPVTWFAVPEFRLQLLPQTITRCDAQTYDYAAPTVGQCE